MGDSHLERIMEYAQISLRPYYFTSPSCLCKLLKLSITAVNGRCWIAFYADESHPAPALQAGAKRLAPQDG